jgi:hypothetical protein
MFDLGNLKRKDILREVAENVDRLINVDLPFRTVSSKLYSETRARYRGPLSLVAARALQSSLKAGGTVLIATGWPDRPHVDPDIAETDGPPGAALLGMALHKAYGASVVFLVEEQLVGAMTKVGSAAGFRMLPLEDLEAAASSNAPLHGAAVVGFPTGIPEAEKLSWRFLEDGDVRAVISVEKGGMNEKGVIHTSRGDDTTETIAKADVLVKAAAERALLTIGIGDGGNEIGMGVIAEELRDWLPFGRQCRCPCGGGIVPVTKTDFLVPAAVSNWGAYGLCAMTSLFAGRREVLHNSALERRVLLSCIDAGLIDGGSGYVSGGVDALPPEVHTSMVGLLGALIDKGLALIRRQAKGAA